MAKKTVVKVVELTVEQQEEQIYKKAYGFKEYEPPKPAIINFTEGQEVKYGGHTKCVVIKSCQFDDRFYFVNVTTRDRAKGLYEHKECVAWHNLCDLTQVKDTTFHTNKNQFDLRFSNGTISSLWHMFCSAGIELNPNYQRDYVWEDKDKEMLIDSIFEDSNIGTFVFASRFEDSNIGTFVFASRDYGTNHKLYEIVDGKQRLTTIFDFMQNKFTYKGYFFYQLSLKDQYAFEEKGIQFAEISSYGNRENVDEKTLLALFLYVNKTGKPQDPAFMQTIQDRYNNLK